MATTLNILFDWAKTLVRTFSLSLTSPTFYSDNFRTYKGYGVKYLLTICFINSLLVTTQMLFTANIINEYLVTGNVTPNVKILDHVLNQFPSLEYDGEKISLLEDIATPITLTTPANQKIVIIDPENKIPQEKRTKMTLFFSSDTLYLNFIDYDGEPFQSFNLPYKAILGADKVTINPAFLRSELTNYSERAPQILIFAIFPASALFQFCLTAAQDLIIIIILVGISYIYSKKLSIRNCIGNCIRLVLFSSGTVMLCKTILTALVPTLISVVWLVQLWVNFLLVIGLLQAIRN